MGCGQISLNRRRVRGGRKTAETQKTTRPEATTLATGKSGGQHDDDEGRDEGGPRGEVTSRVWLVMCYFVTCVSNQC